MGNESINSNAFKAGMARGKQLISAHLRTILTATAEEALRDLCRSKEYMGFTGNTQTSYTCGIYENGKLVDAFVQSDFSRAPVRMKIPKGKTVYLRNPYEGPARSATGYVEVDSLSGRESALSFLRSYKNVPTKGYAIVATTGTEYSEYLENVRHLNVMTSTWQKIGSLFASRVTQMQG